MMSRKSICLMTIAVPLVLLLFSGDVCTAQSGREIEEEPRTASNTNIEILRQVDRDFNTMAADSGLAAAFAYYAADSAVILQRGSYPIAGREVIRASHSDEAGPSPLRWEPYFADMAASGDFGYTLGNYQYIYKDSSGAEKISYGHYVTIWKKQPDGNWKYVLDTGVSTPPPKPGSETNQKTDND
jgi:ketosteroid isomerase-like protein